jgi:hypothetical protein
MYEEHRFTEEEITKANNVSLIDYVQRSGLKTKKVGDNYYHVRGFGGLYINTLQNKWNCFSQNKGGGPIQLVMFLQGKTWVEAVKTLLGNSYESNLARPNHFNVQKQEKGKFILPEKNNTYKHVFAYLIQTRGIDKDIVYNCIKNKILYEDKNRNCVFVGYSINEPQYATKHGTNISYKYKGEVLNSNKAFPFLFGEKGDTVYVFESPIDTLSHATLAKIKGLDWHNQYRLSLGGLSDLGLENFLKGNQNIKNIFFCLDNDEPGREATEKYIEKYKDRYNVDIQKSNLKDFNEDLVAIDKKKLVLEDELEI